MIVRMKHLDLICVANEKETALERLRTFGAVHLDLAGASGAEFAALCGEQAEAERAVRIILKARGAEEVAVRAHGVAEVLALDADRATLIAEQERLVREVKYFEPYGDFDPVLAKKLVDRGIDLSDELPARLPEMRLGRLKEKLARVENRIAIDTAKIAEVDERTILAQFPALKDRIAFAAAKEKMEEQGKVAVISGWIPVPQAEALVGEARRSGWGVLLREPAEGEIPPSLIRPPAFVRPVKALFEGLGIAPAYNEADVSVPFMCYFSLFFAMLVGDGAYGAIFLAGTLALRKRLTRSWFALMLTFSLSTVAWGVLSNTWFGAAIPWCAAWPTVRWLSGADAAPGHTYDNMMFLCFTIGVTHLMLARLWSGFSRLNDRSCLSEFAWAGIVLFMYVLTNTIVGIFGGVPTWCFWMLGVSFVVLFWQAKGIDKGMLFLNAMSVLGDIISYVRLFAVGLASVQVASNFNQMAIGLGLPGWIKWLPLVLILLVGHGLNIAMAALSVLVHAVRLNTLEFSNHKGISWAGYAFRPFKLTKE